MCVGSTSRRSASPRRSRCRRPRRRCRSSFRRRLSSGSCSRRRPRGSSRRSAVCPRRRCCRSRRSRRTARAGARYRRERVTRRRRLPARAGVRAVDPAAARVDREAETRRGAGDARQRCDRCPAPSAPSSCPTRWLEFTTTAPAAPTATQNELPGAHETALRAPDGLVACCCQVCRCSERCSRSVVPRRPRRRGRRTGRNTPAWAAPRLVELHEPSDGVATAGMAAI